MDMPPEEKHEEDPNVREARRHARAAREEMGRAWEGLFPPGFREHRQAARREWLLAMRSWVNAAIDRLDRMESKEPPPENNPPV